MPETAKRDAAPSPDRVGFLPADSEDRLTALAARFLGESGGASTSSYRAWVMPQPLKTIAEPRSWDGTQSDTALWPAGMSLDARAWAIVPLRDASGLVVEDENEDGMGMVLCVSSAGPRKWTSAEMSALELVAGTAAVELQLRGGITKHKDITEKLRASPLHDPITELANRELFLDRIAHALMRCARQADRHLAVMSVTVDQFAEIENGFGYEAAQEVLREIANRLRHATRNIDSVARVSGEEFGILLEQLKENSDAARVAKRIHDSLRAAIKTTYDEFSVSASIGVVLSTTGIDSPGRLIQLAALARERSSGTGAEYELFDPTMQRKAQDRLHQEMELRRGIESGEFELHYQPIVSLESGRIVELEALVRWRHPKRGLVSASEFIPLAEETGLVVPMGWLTLTQACDQVREWRSRNHEVANVPVSINMTAANLSHREMGDRMRGALGAFGLTSRALNVEITEGLLVGDPTRAKQVLDEMRALGVGVHIDDFGTGYSSLQYLHELPLDAIKIDRRFVARLGGTTREAQVATTIRELARHIGVPVIAEGVETAEQLAQVRALGCEFAQGYLFSHPLPPAEITALLEQNPRW
jgi:diguanylate cyclase (GGDEF)-like protein